MDVEIKGEMQTALQQLAEVAGLLQQAADRLMERESTFAVDAQATLGRIVATVETQREAELEGKLLAAEARLAEMEKKLNGLNAAAAAPTGRKTLPPAMVSLLAKQGVAVDSIEAGALDAALVSLSVEQRIAVKAQLSRAGLLG
jgi:hypothetical protein